MKEKSGSSSDKKACFPRVFKYKFFLSILLLITAVSIICSNDVRSLKRLIVEHLYRNNVSEHLTSSCNSSAMENVGQDSLKKARSSLATKDVKLVDCYFSLKLKILSGSEFSEELVAFKDSLTYEQQSLLDVMIKDLEKYAEQGIPLLSQIVNEAETILADNESWYTYMTNKTKRWLNGLVTVVHHEKKAFPVNYNNSEQKKSLDSVNLVAKYLYNHEIDAAAVTADKLLQNNADLNEKTKLFLHSLIEYNHVRVVLKKMKWLLR